MIGTLEQLFEYERVEDAWAAILKGKGHAVYLEFSDQDRDAQKEPYIEVQLNSVVPLGQLYPYNGELLPSWWKGSLITRVVTMRGVNSDKQRVMTGRVRIEIQRYRNSFTEARLPFHAVAELRETGLTRGVDGTNDWSEITADITFHVRDDAWPK